MPTYEYECEKCGHRFEVFHSMSEEPRKRCPKCRGKLRRLIGTGAGMIFKGSGFYVTDYRSDSYKQQKNKESGDSAPVKDQPKPKSGEGGETKEKKKEKKKESGGSGDS
jgi:putative FmdB family regulatory protein